MVLPRLLPMADKEIDNTSRLFCGEQAGSIVSPLSKSGQYVGLRIVSLRKPTGSKRDIQIFWEPVVQYVRRRLHEMSGPGWRRNK